MSLEVSWRVVAPCSTPTTKTCRWGPRPDGRVELSSPVSGYIYSGSALALSGHLRPHGLLAVPGRSVLIRLGRRNVAGLRMRDVPCFGYLSIITRMLGPSVTLQESLVFHILDFRNNADLGKEFPSCMTFMLPGNSSFLVSAVFSSSPFSALPFQPFHLLRFPFPDVSKRLQPKNRLRRSVRCSPCFGGNDVGCPWRFLSAGSPHVRWPMEIGIDCLQIARTNSLPQAVSPSALRLHRQLTPHRART